MTPLDTSIPFGFCQCGCGKKTSISPQSSTRQGVKKGFPVHYVRGHQPIRRGFKQSAAHIAKRCKQRVFIEERISKKCSKCHLVKLSQEFGTRNSKPTIGGIVYVYLRSHCKECERKSGTKRYHSNKHIASERYRTSILKCKYGLSRSDFDSLMECQDGKCAICHREPPKRRLMVDHDHFSGKVRGLLCTQCNTGIGMMKESPEILRSAIEYLCGSTYPQNSKAERMKRKESGEKNAVA